MSDVKIDYPCSWTFRIIGERLADVESAVSECLGGKFYTLRPANSSRTGRYISMHLETVVESEAFRNQLFSLLQNHDAVKMVL